MKFSETPITGGRVEFLASPKFMAIQHKFEEKTASGTPVKITDGLDKEQVGICLYDVDPDVNPNGAVVVMGIVDKTKLASENSTGAEYFPTLIFVKSEAEED